MLAAMEHSLTELLPAIPISHDPGPAMNDVVLVDDHILLSLLLGDEPRELRPRGGTIATTGLWYHRLCPAPADKAVVESMSRQLGNVAPDIATEVIAAVMELPETIELVSLRSLGWPMDKLVRDGTRLNLFALEALAAARFLNAGIFSPQANDNEPLKQAALAQGIPIFSVPTAYV